MRHPKPTTTGLYQSQPTTSQSLANSNYGSTFDDFDYSDPYNDFSNTYSRANDNDYIAPRSGSNITVDELRKTDDYRGLYNSQIEEDYGRSLDSETKYRNAQIEDMQGFDYMGAGSLAIQGLGTAMEMGLYGDRKDYIKNANRGLEQNIQFAKEDQRDKQARNANLQTTFGRNG